MKPVSICPNYKALMANYQGGGIDHHEMSHLVSAALEDIRTAADPKGMAEAFILEHKKLFAIEQEAQALHQGFPARAREVARQAVRARPPKSNSTR